MKRTIKSIVCIAFALNAKEAFSLSQEAPQSIASNPLFLVMGVLAAVLLLVIFILSGVLITSAKSKIKEIVNTKTLKVLGGTVLGFTTFDALSQNADVKVDLYHAVPIADMHPMAFYTLFIVILLELFVILWLSLLIQRIISKNEVKEIVESTKKPAESNFFTRIITRKILGVKPSSSDIDVMLDHDYDGIRELDNDLPPWWKYGFILTIITAFVYMISYHVTHTSKSSLEEYNAEMAQGEASVKAYRTKMALNVDESNAVFLDASDKVASGKAIFQKNCAVCHGNDGQGLVGPNFTDKYWLYGNKAGDIFKIVKNGTSKGMKAWKDELTPTDIQNVISFIHTLQGTNPPNPKAADGEIMEYTETVAETNLQIDSSKIIEIK